MSALQTNINTLMSANSVDELRNRLVAILTTIAETPAGSGITAVTSDDGSISIDNTDPSAPDLSIGAVVSYFTVTNLNENGNGIVTAISNRIGGTISFVNAAAFSYTLTRTGGAALTGTVKAYLSSLTEDGSGAVVGCIGSGIDIGETFDLLNYDGAALGSGSIIKNALLTIIYVP